MSMISFAQLNLQGRLTSDPEVSTLDSGTTMCKFRVAVNRRIPGGKERTSFIPVTVFGRDAVRCGEYLTKGKGVHVTGTFETDEWTDKNGSKRTGFGCVAREVIFGSGGSRDESNEGDSRGPSNYDNDYDRTRKHLKGNRGRY